METAAASLLEASGYTSSATYDALNRIVTDTTPDASVTRHGYDEGGYLTKLEVQHRGSSTWTTVVHAVEHDAHGRRIRVERGDDGTGSAGLTTSYTYDPRSQRVTRIVTERSSDSAVLQDLRYHTDAVGLVTKVRDVSQQTHYYANAVVSADLDYHYDPLYRLVEASGRESTALGSTQHGATLPAMGPQPDASDPAAMRRYTQTYEYDPADNLIKLVHTPVGGTGWTRRYNYTTTGNRLQSTSISGDSPGATYTTPGTYTYSDHYEYDEHGSMTSMPHLPTMTWGHRDELVECTVGSETLHFQYAGGQRVRKHVTKTGTTTEERVYIGRYEKYTRRISGAEDMVRETLHLGDDLGRVAMVETKTVEGGTVVGSPVGMWRHPLGNMLGTAGGETTEDGSVIGYEEYHPYGTTAYRAKASGIDVSERRYRYTGMEQDEETGLGYHTARYYAGWLGRWVSADPIGLGGGGNRFGYVGGDPVGKRDPGGMEDPEAAKRHPIIRLLSAGTDFLRAIEDAAVSTGNADVRRQVNASRRERALEAAVIEKAVAQYEDVYRAADAEAAARYEGIVESLGGLHPFGKYEPKFGENGSGEGPRLVADLRDRLVNEAMILRREGVGIDDRIRSLDEIYSKELGRIPTGADIVAEKAAFYGGGKDSIALGVRGKVADSEPRRKTTAPKERMTRVGRWMSEAELEVMMKTDQVQEGAGGLTFASVNGADDFMRQAKSGSVYVEYDVPTNSLLPGGKDGWVKTIGPNAATSQKFKIRKQGGEVSPRVRNISPVLRRKD